MAAPFSGEDMVKRGILSALIGIDKAKKSGATGLGGQKQAQPVHNPWQQQLDESQPCSTWRLQQQDQQQSRIVQSSPGQQTKALSHQLENTFLASPHQIVTSPHQLVPSPHQIVPSPHQLVPSPHNIFQEILCECGPMEQFQRERNERAAAMGQAQSFPSPDPWFAAPSDFDLANPQQPFIRSSPPRRQHYSPEHQQLPSSQQPDDPLVCPNCFHNVNLVPLSTIQHRISQIGPNSRVENQGSLPPPSSNTYPSQANWPQFNHPSSPPQFQQNPVVNTTEPHKQLESHQLKQLLSTNQSNMSFEELIKMVVSVVKDSGLLKAAMSPGSQDTFSNTNESPEEILRRKRQQNNEAAARYRRRQKEAKLSKNDEVELLTERNRELRDQIHEIQSEMKRIRHLINK